MSEPPPSSPPSPNFSVSVSPTTSSSSVSAQSAISAANLLLVALLKLNRALVPVLLRWARTRRHAYIQRSSRDVYRKLLSDNDNNSSPSLFLCVGACCLPTYANAVIRPARVADPFDSDDDDVANDHGDTDTDDDDDHAVEGGTGVQTQLNIAMSPSFMSYPSVPSSPGMGTSGSLPAGVGGTGGRTTPSSIPMTPITPTPTTPNVPVLSTSPSSSTQDDPAPPPDVEQQQLPPPASSAASTTAFNSAPTPTATGGTTAPAATDGITVTIDTDVPEPHYTLGSSSSSTTTTQQQNTQRQAASSHHAHPHAGAGDHDDDRDRIDNGDSGDDDHFDKQPRRPKPAVHEATPLLGAPASQAHTPTQTSPQPSLAARHRTPSVVRFGATTTTVFPTHSPSSSSLAASSTTYHHHNHHHASASPADTQPPSHVLSSPAQFHVPAMSVGLVRRSLIACHGPSGGGVSLEEHYYRLLVAQEERHRTLRPTYWVHHAVMYGWTTMGALVLFSAVVIALVVRFVDVMTTGERVAFGFSLVATAAVSEADKLLRIVVPTRASSQRGRRTARTYDGANDGGGGGEGGREGRGVGRDDVRRLVRPGRLTQQAGGVDSGGLGGMPDDNGGAAGSIQPTVSIGDVSALQMPSTSGIFG